MIDQCYTKHASTRAQQRSVPPAVVEWLFEFGCSTRHQSADVYFFDKRGKRRLRSFLGRIAYRRIETLLDAYAVVSDDGQIVTVAHRAGRLKLR